MAPSGSVPLHLMWIKEEYHKIDMNFDDEIAYVVNELDNLSEKTF